MFIGSPIILLFSLAKLFFPPNIISHAYTCAVLISQDHNHLWVVQSVQGDPLRELFSRRSVDSILSQLEARRGKIASATAAAAGDFSPPLQDFPGVGEGGPLTKKPRLALEDGMDMYTIHIKIHGKA